MVDKFSIVAYFYYYLVGVLVTGEALFGGVYFWGDGFLLKCK